MIEPTHNRSLPDVTVYTTITDSDIALFRLRFLTRSSIYRYDFYSRTQAAIRCAGVCKSWRASALLDGRLWSSIDCQQHELTATLLERSRRFSVSAHIRIVSSHQSEDKHGKFLHSLRLILENAHRLKELRTAVSDRL